MSPAELAKPITAILHQQLKPLGFRKRGKALWRDIGGLRQIIALQSSRTSAHGKLIVTLNIGVLCEPLLASYHSAFSASDGQWFERIGWFHREQDHWWTISSLEGAERAGREITGIVVDIVLPVLEPLSTRQGLLAALEQGTGRGLTERQRQEYARELRELLEREP